jgi:hypothetical protein
VTCVEALAGLLAVTSCPAELELVMLSSVFISFSLAV